MDVAIGLPNAVGGATRQQLIDWARAAEEAGFSSLGTIDRIVSGFESAGCDELFMTPASSDPEQVGLLAEAAGL